MIRLASQIETKRVRWLEAVVERAVDVKCIAATDAVLSEALAAERFRAALYRAPRGIG